MTRGGDRVIAAIELTAAGFLAAVTALSFVAVALRYGFATALPDSHDIGRNLLGIVIFWGIAVATYRNEHIGVDFAWAAAGPGLRRAIELGSGLFTLGCMAVFAWMLADKVIATEEANLRTFDLRLPVWTFFLVAWAGIAAAVVLLAVRLVRMVSGAAGLEPPPAPAYRD